MQFTDIEPLIKAISDRFIRGEQFATFRELVQAFEAGFPAIAPAIQPGNPLRKRVEECIEKAAVRATRTLIGQTDTTHQAFDALVDFYDNQQPSLNSRTSTSIANQAYSTPLPIAWVASVLAGIDQSKTVYEPTAGNGSLLIGADPAKVEANELDPFRRVELEQQGYVTTGLDATDYNPVGKQFDVVIANPPFGTVEDPQTRRSKSWTVRGGNATPQYSTTQIDHAIALKALRVMKDDGRAVLILGAPMAQKVGNEEGASSTYGSEQNVRFWKSLYDNYNVTQHFTVSGDLYRKQGTTFPIDVVVIEGRGKSKRRLPAAELPKVYRSFSEIKELIPNVPIKNSILESSRSEPSAIAGSSRIAADRDQVAERPDAAIDAAGDVDDRAGSGGRGGIDSPGNEATDRSGRDERDRDTRTGRSTDGLGAGDDRQQPGASGAAIADGRDRVSPNSDERPGTTGRSAIANRRNDGRRMDDRNDRNLPGIGTQLNSTTEINGLHQNDSGDIVMEEMNVIEAQKAQEKQVAYTPASRAAVADTLLPANMATPVANALQQLEKRVGSLDEYIAKKCGLGDGQVQPFAEQVDSVALAIDNLERGEGFIIGDQTGIGKGLQNAMIAKSVMEGRINLPENIKTVVWVTYDPKLYADALRDLEDVGVSNINPLLTNAGMKVESPGGIRVKTQSNREKHNELLRSLAAAGETGDYNIVFTTYSQMQTIKGGKETDRRHFLREIAPNAVFLFDESHNAGGTPQQDDDRFARYALNQAPNRADFARTLVRRAGGVVFSSATYAKNPWTMTLYAARTAMRHSVEEADNLPGMIQSGGIPLQQVFAAKLTESGQYIRRERSYEGVEFGAKIASVDHDIAEQQALVLSKIMEFSRGVGAVTKSVNRDLRDEAKRVLGDAARGEAGATSTNFTSIMHNVINQGLLMLKAEATVQSALESLRRGEKPVITLANTMGSIIGDVAEEQDLRPGEEIDISYGTLLKRYLERSRDITVKSAFDDAPKRRRLEDAELGEELVAQYEAALKLIDETDWGAMPISPIDYIRHRLSQEKITDLRGNTRSVRCDEITGRTDRAIYTETGELVYQVRPTAERKTEKSVKRVSDFNNGDLDVLILNRSGSTGISLHASERFVDQRPRRMIIAQPELDINQFMQMLGRIHRTGQVEKPRFEILMGDIPAEKRPGAVLLKKMASLNANTSAARQGGFELNEIPDFLNEYGDQVVTELMQQNPELHAALGRPIKGLANEDEDITDTEDAVKRVTGRIPLLPLKDQEKLYARIESEYKELVEREQALGNSILEAETLELDAKTTSFMEVMPRRTGITSSFGAPVYLEVIDAKSPRKPLTQLEVVNLVRKELELDPVEDLFDHRPDAVQQEARFKLVNTGREIDQKIDKYLEKYRAVAAKRVQAQILEKDEEMPPATEFAARVANEISATQEKIEKQKETVMSILRNYPIGQTVKVVNGKDGSIYYGVVARIVDKTGNNPVTPSDWKMELQIADSAKQITVPFSKINKDGLSGVRLDIVEQTYDGTDIYDLFDERQTATREKRQVFTGNVVRAFEKFKGGKLVNFRDSKGRIRQGLLMNRDFSIDKALEQQAVRMPTVVEAQRFLETVRGELKTADEQLRVSWRARGLQISVPRGKEAGGRYFLDGGLLSANGGADFVQMGSSMVMDVPAYNQEAVLQYIFEEYGGLLAFDAREKAREIVGAGLPELEQVTEEEAEIIIRGMDGGVDLPPVVEVKDVEAAAADLERMFNLPDDAAAEAIAPEVPEASLTDAQILTTYVEELLKQLQLDTSQDGSNFHVEVNMGANNVLFLDRFDENILIKLADEELSLQFDIEDGNIVLALTGEQTTREALDQFTALLETGVVEPIQPEAAIAPEVAAPEAVVEVPTSFTLADAAEIEEIESYATEIFNYAELGTATNSPDFRFTLNLGDDDLEIWKQGSTIAFVMESKLDLLFTAQSNGEITLSATGTQTTAQALAGLKAVLSDGAAESLLTANQSKQQAELTVEEFLADAGIPTSLVLMETLDFTMRATPTIGNIPGTVINRTPEETEPLIVTKLDDRLTILQSRNADEGYELGFKITSDGLLLDSTYVRGNVGFEPGIAEYLTDAWAAAGYAQSLTGQVQALKALQENMPSKALDELQSIANAEAPDQAEAIATGEAAQEAPVTAAQPEAIAPEPERDDSLDRQARAYATEFFARAGLNPKGELQENDFRYTVERNGTTLTIQKQDQGIQFEQSNPFRMVYLTQSETGELDLSLIRNDEVWMYDAQIGLEYLYDWVQDGFADQLRGQILAELAEAETPLVQAEERSEEMIVSSPALALAQGRQAATMAETFFIAAGLTPSDSEFQDLNLNEVIDNPTTGTSLLIYKAGSYVELRQEDGEKVQLRLLEDGQFGTYTTENGSLDPTGITIGQYSRDVIECVQRWTQEGYAQLWREQRSQGEIPLTPMPEAEAQIAQPVEAIAPEVEPLSVVISPSREVIWQGYAEGVTVAPFDSKEALESFSGRIDGGDLQLETFAQELEFFRQAREILQTGRNSITPGEAIALIQAQKQVSAEAIAPEAPQETVQAETPITAAEKQEPQVQYSPILRRYIQVMEEHPEEAVIAKMGDTYYAYFYQAETISEITGLELGDRAASPRNRDERVPFVSFTETQKDSVIAQLQREGFDTVLYDHDTGRVGPQAEAEPQAPQPVEAIAPTVEEMEYFVLINPPKVEIELGLAEMVKIAPFGSDVAADYFRQRIESEKLQPEFYEQARQIMTSNGRDSITPGEAIACIEAQRQMEAQTAPEATEMPMEEAQAEIPVEVPPVAAEAETVASDDKFTVDHYYLLVPGLDQAIGHFDGLDAADQFRRDHAANPMLEFNRARDGAYVKALGREVISPDEFLEWAKQQAAEAIATEKPKEVVYDSLLLKYLETASARPDDVVLAKIGDSYYAYFADAEAISDVAGLELSDRIASKQSADVRVPMVSLPESQRDAVIEKLNLNGLNVVFLDPKTGQVQDQSEAALEAQSATTAPETAVEAIAQPEAQATEPAVPPVEAIAPEAQKQEESQPAVEAEKTRKPRRRQEKPVVADAAGEGEDKQVVRHSATFTKENGQAIVQPAELEPTEAIAQPAAAAVEQPAAAFGVGDLSALEITRQMIAKHDPATMAVLQKSAEQPEKQNRFSPSLREMRDWMTGAKTLGKEDVYLKRIAQLANKMLENSDEVFKAPAERDPNFQNPEFTLNETQYGAMQRDIQQARDTEIAGMAKKLLALIGQKSGNEVVFEKPNGNYRLSWNPTSATLQVSAKNQDGKVILKEVDGKIDPSSCTSPMDKEVFTQFLNQVQERVKQLETNKQANER